MTDFYSLNRDQVLLDLEQVVRQLIAYGMDHDEIVGEVEAFVDLYCDEG